MGVKNTAYINKEMLIWARNETPFATAEDVEAHSSSISAEKLYKWESGEDLPSVNEAKRLASIYKVPFACFYLSEIPEKKPKPYTDRRTALGTSYDVISYDLWSEIQRIVSNRECLIEFTEEDDILPIPPVSDTSIEGIAKQIRDFLELKTPLKNKTAYGSNPFNYFRDILERKNIMVSQISGVSLKEMKGISMYYDRFPIIAVNNKDFDNAKVFSLFHELAHIFRRSASLCLIDFDERNDREEKICDLIAAEVLMPRESFEVIAKNYAEKYGSTWDSTMMHRLGGRFGVSAVSALMRLNETNLIPRDNYQNLYEQMIKEFESKRNAIEAARKGRENKLPFVVKYLSGTGHLLPRTMILSHASGKIFLGEMCKILNVKSSHIGRIEQAVMYK